MIDGMDIEEEEEGLAEDSQVGQPGLEASQHAPPPQDDGDDEFVLATQTGLGPGTEKAVSWAELTTEIEDSEPLVDVEESSDLDGEVAAVTFHSPLPSGSTDDEDTEMCARCTTPASGLTSAGDWFELAFEKILEEYFAKAYISSLTPESWNAVKDPVWVAPRIIVHLKKTLMAKEGMRPDLAREIELGVQAHTRVAHYFDGEWGAQVWNSACERAMKLYNDQHPTPSSSQ